MSDETTPMESLLKEFRDGKKNRTEFEQSAISHLLKNPHRFSLMALHPDDQMDFLCFYFPRFRKAVDSYQDTGHSFDAYVHRSIQYALRDYKREEQLKHQEEEQLWHHSDTVYWTRQEENLVQDVTQPYETDTSPVPDTKHQAGSPFGIEIISVYIA